MQAPEYAAANAAFRKQKSRLTRAINSGDPDKVITEVKRAVDEWSRAPFNNCWPDDWSRWQRALDDAWNKAHGGWAGGPRLEDIDDEIYAGR